VLVTDYAWPDLERERAALAPHDVELVAASTGDVDELIELAGDVEAILTCWKPVTREVLEGASECLTVARYGVGLDNIDVAAASELGMIVSNVPDFCVDEVADHTMALILAHHRHLLAFAAQTAAGGWDNDATGPMHRLRGQTLGLVGFGRLAQATAARAVGFGLDVIAWSRSLGEGPRGAARGVASLEQLLATSDVVSLHVPHAPSTDRLIDAEALARMKRGAYLVNTSRGRLVDVDALADAIRSGHLAGAGLDVMPDEPPAPDHPLRHLAGVTMTPHAAFDSVESRIDLQDKAAANVASVLEGTVPATIVNPEVLDHPGLRLGPQLR
jgi:D-3-phosphoglycerate dehydrogenase